MLLSVTRRYASDMSEAQDLLQEAWVEIFHSITQFDPKRGDIEPWMRTITARSAVKKYRKKHRQFETFELEELPEKAVDPTILAKLQADELHQLIAQLPEGYREVFNLYVLEQFSHQEIAELLGIKASSSRSKLTRARQMLQAKLMLIV